MQPSPSLFFLCVDKNVTRQLPVPTALEVKINFFCLELLLVLVFYLGHKRVTLESVVLSEALRGSLAHAPAPLLVLMLRPILK